LENARYFSAEPGPGLRWYKKTAIPFLSLPGHIYAKIMDYVLANLDSYALNLTTQADFGDLCGILYPQRDFHHWYIPAFLRGKTFSLSMTASGNYHTFDFAKLRRLVDTEFQAVFGTLRSSVPDIRFESITTFKLDLHIHVDRPTTLEVIRINAMPIVVAIFSTKATQKINILLHVNDDIEQYSFTVLELRKAVSQRLDRFIEHDIADVRERCSEV